MAWGAFLGGVIGAYAVYYVLNILYDLLISRQGRAPAEAGVHYNMRELMDEEESPEEVGPEQDYEEASEAAYPAERKLAAEPVLRVEGQGIPLDDFLRDAKSYSSSIF